MANVKYLNARQRTRARNKQNIEYKKRAQKPYMIRLHKVNDADVIAQLEKQPNKTDYIRQLVRKDIEQ